MGLVTDLRHQHERSRIGRQGNFGAPIGKHQLFPPDLAALALFNADDARNIHAQLFEYLTGHGHLSLSAIDQHHVRNAWTRGCVGSVSGRCHSLRSGPIGGAQGLRQLAVAPLQHLAHGGKIVPGRDVFDGVAAVLRRLHGMPLKYHARRLRGLACRMRNVKAFDAQSRKIATVCRCVCCRLCGRRVWLADFSNRFWQVPGFDAQNGGQRPRAFLLGALFGQQTRQLQAGILPGHFQPCAPVFTRLVHHHNAPPGCIVKRLLQDRRQGNGRDQHVGPLGGAQVVLRHKGLQHCPV